MPIGEIANAEVAREEMQQDVRNVCEELGVEPTAHIFKRTPEEIRKIVQICKEHYVNPNMIRTCFEKPLEEVEEIFAVCDKLGIEIKASIFRGKTSDLYESILYVAKNYGRKYLRHNIITRDVNNLKVSMPCLQKLGLLKYITDDTTIFDLTEDEILERTAMVMYFGRRIHKIVRFSKEDKLDKMFNYSREYYERYLEKHSISEKTRACQKELLKSKIEESEMK